MLYKGAARDRRADAGQLPGGPTTPAIASMEVNMGRVASGMLGGLLALALAVPAAAATVTREPAPLPDLIEDTSCGYLVLVTFPVNRESVVTIFDASGAPLRSISSGPLVVTFTNADTHESLTANISGPTVIDYHRGTAYQLGRIGGPVPGLEGLNLVAGRADLNSGERTGHYSVNVCEALAPGT